MTKLEWVEDRSEWPDLIAQKASFASGALGVDLRTGLAIVEEFEKHQAWNYVHEDRETFYKYRMWIEPEKLEAIKQEVSIILGRGEPHPQTIRELGKPGQYGQGRPKNRGSDETPIGRGPEYVLARLIRQGRFDLVERVKIGELSPYIASIEAGFRHKPTPLEVLRAAWKRASTTERQEFRDWVKQYAGLHEIV